MCVRGHVVTRTLQAHLNGAGRADADLEILTVDVKRHDQGRPSDREIERFAHVDAP